MDLHLAALGTGVMATALLLAGLTARRRHPRSRPARLLLAAAVGLLGAQAILFGLSIGN